MIGAVTLHADSFGLQFVLGFATYFLIARVFADRQRVGGS